MEVFGSSLRPFRALRKPNRLAVLTRWLGENGNDPNIKDEAGYTLLSRAIMSGKDSVVPLLLSHDKIIPDCRDQDGRTPVSRAAEHGRTSIFQLLLSHEVDPDAKDDNERTPLSYAAENGHEEIVKLLLGSSRVDANWRDLHGLTALVQAVQNYREGIVEIMLKYEGIIHHATSMDGQNVFSLAAEWGCAGIVELLLNGSTVHPNITDKDRQTAAFQTIKQPWNDRRYPRVLWLLVQHGFNLNDVDADGRTLLSRAAECGHESAVAWLVKQENVNMNTTDNQLRTPVWWAVEAGNEGIVQQFLQREDVDLEVGDKFGHTPLSRAVLHGHAGVVEVMLPKDRVTLHSHTQRGDLDFVTRLIEAKYDLNTRDSLGRTPLHTATLFDQFEVAMHLVHAQADINAKDVNGMTPIRFAVQRRHGAIVDMLLHSSADTTDTTSKEWFDLYNPSKVPNLVLELSQSSDESKIMRNNDPSRVQMKHRSSERRLVLFSNCSDWEACLDKNTKDILNSRKSPLVSCVRVQDEEASFFMIALLPSYIEDQKDRRIVYKQCCVGWSMVAPKRSKDGLSWKSVDHWSTLSFGSIPKSGTKFFASFIQTWKINWLESCDLAQSHLISRRVDQLREKGCNPETIHYLAKDAQTWATLRGMLRVQVREIRSFSEEYVRVYDQDNGSRIMRKAIDSFADEVNGQISQLEQTVKELLQFEFAWVSINEAHKSTSIATSMKRLSWITFIFLPAMFASSVFGMNVNLLASNPDWRWFLLFGGGLLTLTGFGWLVFKYSKVETWIENHIGARLQRWSNNELRRRSTKLPYSPSTDTLRDLCGV